MPKHATLKITIDDEMLVKAFNRYKTGQPEHLRVAMIDSMKQIGLQATGRYMKAAKLMNYETGYTIGSKGGRLNIRTGRLARSISGGFAPSGGGGTEGSREGIRRVNITGVGLTGVFGSRVPYAAIHEYGGSTHPKVTEKMRRWAWAMFYKSGNPTYKGIALTKKSNLTIDIPARPYMRPAAKASQNFIKQIFEKQLQMLLRKYYGKNN